MKMGDRRLKRLDKLGTQIQNKPILTGEPANRSERRKFNRVLRHERVRPEEIDQEAIFAALKEHYVFKKRGG